MKTADLTGAALDWAVWKALELPDTYLDYNGHAANFSTDWAQGGPIIEREGISTLKFEGLWYAFSNLPVHDCIHDIADGYVGETALIASMRCYVTSKLGDEFEMPEELK